MITTREATKSFFKNVQHAPFCIAPERGEKLAEEIFGARRWEIRESTTTANFYAIPKDAAIFLSFAGLASLWSLAYAAFNIMDLASRAQRQSPNIVGQIEIDIGKQFASLKLGEYIKYAASLFKADAPWPPDLLVPVANAPLDSSMGRVNNVFYGALSWILLHEIAHVHHRDEALIPSSLRVDNEYRADDFASKWILEDSGRGLQREFRVLMIVVALAWLFLNEKTVGKGTVHPPAILRFREAADLFRLGQRSVGYENAAYVLKAIFDPATPSPKFDTAEEFFAWVGKRLEDLFPG